MRYRKRCAQSVQLMLFISYTDHVILILLAARLYVLTYTIQ